MVSSERFKELAASFAGTSVVPHMDRIAFRTTRKIFATLPPDERTANLLLDATLQEAAMEARPKAFSPVPGGWGRMGYTVVDLSAVDEIDLMRVLTEAHALASEKKASRKKR